MEPFEVKAMADACLSGAPPPCSSACPLGVDVRGLIGKINKGDWGGAAKVYAKQVLFPGLVSALCPEPCRKRCLLPGAAMELRLLEAAVMAQAPASKAEAYYTPAKNKRILIVGGGLTGLSCGVKLAKRGYKVELWEQSARLGGQVYAAAGPGLDMAAIIQDIAAATALSYLTIRLNQPVRDLSRLEFDAALVAIGQGGAALAATAGRDGVFIRDRLERPDQGLLADIGQGIAASYALEGYVKTGLMKYEEPIRQGCDFLPWRLPDTLPPIRPADGQGYTAAEAKQEAARCRLCDCHNCSDVCDMLAWFRKDAKKVIVDIHNSLHPTALTGKPGLRQLSSCMLCDRCQQVCPPQLSFRRLCLESRRELQQSGKLPPAFYHFFLDDLAFSQSEEAACALAPQGPQPRYLFFPGCQLAAADPAYVLETYRLLARVYPGQVAVLQRCCGAIPEWAGREDLRDAALNAIREQWLAWGRPQVLLACPSCRAMFDDYMPKLEAKLLWEQLPEGLRLPEGKGLTVHVFDPCASRRQPRLQDNVRQLLITAGFQLEELPAQGGLARCCGYGGLIGSVNPELKERVEANNAALGPRPYIVYCVNCRDSFLRSGKQSWHLLDLLLFGDWQNRRPGPPTLLQRRDNRLLAQQLLQKEYGLPVQNIVRPELPPIYISMELQHKMDRELIHAGRVRDCIMQGEQTGRLVYRPAIGSFSCCLQEDVYTLWVEFSRRQGGGYTLLNAYQHRMRFEENQ